jgi:hypothetical protein
MRTSVILRSFNEIDFGRYRLPIITVYDNPIDFEGKCVARLFDCDEATRYCVVSDSIDELLSDIPLRFSKIEKMEDDDPNIVAIYV